MSIPHFQFMAIQRISCLAMIVLFCLPLFGRNRTFVVQVEGGGELVLEYIDTFAQPRATDQFKYAYRRASDEAAVSLFQIDGESNGPRGTGSFCNYLLDTALTDGEHLSFLVITLNDGLWLICKDIRSGLDGNVELTLVSGPAADYNHHELAYRLTDLHRIEITGKNDNGSPFRQLLEMMPDRTWTLDGNPYINASTTYGIIKPGADGLSEGHPPDLSQFEMPVNMADVRQGKRRTLAQAAAILRNKSQGPVPPAETNASITKPDEKLSHSQWPVTSAVLAACALAITALLWRLNAAKRLK